MPPGLWLIPRKDQHVQREVNRLVGNSPPAALPAAAAQETLVLQCPQKGGPALLSASAGTVTLPTPWHSYLQDGGWKGFQTSRWALSQV